METESQKHQILSVWILLVFHQQAFLILKRNEQCLSNANEIQNPEIQNQEIRNQDHSQRAQRITPVKHRY